MINGEIGNVIVTTTEHCNLGPEHWADRATEQVIAIGEDAHPLIVDQAKAFKDRIRHGQIALEHIFLLSLGVFESTPSSYHLVVFDSHFHDE